MTKTATSNDVLNYYSNNWERIANCYDLDDRGLPVDPAWYRRRLYNQFLEKHKPKSVLDIGCGGGWTTLDSLKLGVKTIGLEPVIELKDFAENLLQKEGFDGKNILNEDLLYIKTLENNSQDCIALLSVIPHVPLNKIEKIHKELYRVLKPGGKLVIAYRNELFDLFTFNSMTLEFYKNRIWELDELKKLSETPEVLKALSGLINNPDLPGKFHTNAKDKSFGKLNRFKTNPLTIKEYLSSFGLKWLESHFYHFHAVPPLISYKGQDLKKINHHLELNYSSDWRANFMCPMYLVISEKEL